MIVSPFTTQKFERFALIVRNHALYDIIKPDNSNVCRIRTFDLNRCSPFKRFSILSYDP